MSGHSKWHNIQGKKGKSDKAKSSQFTKCARAITVAARTGGPDPAMNFTLRLAIDKAKEVNMPKDNIERAIKKGTGELNDGTTMEEALYEGFGPAGVAFMVEAITDNNTRTVSEIKSLFSKNGGNVGSPGSVKWQFQHCGVVRFKIQDTNNKIQRDDLEIKLIDSGAEDIIDSEYGIEVRCSVESFQKVLEAVKSFGLEPESAGLEWVAKETITLDEEAHAKVQAFYDLLDEHDDVKAVYTNEA